LENAVGSPVDGRHPARAQPAVDLIPTREEPGLHQSPCSPSAGLADSTPPDDGSSFFSCPGGIFSCPAGPAGGGRLVFLWTRRRRLFFFFLFFLFLFLFGFFFFFFGFLVRLFFGLFFGFAWEHFGRFDGFRFFGLFAFGDDFVESFGSVGERLL